MKGVFNLNINNQAENKKPFGTRLFILFTVCMIVVAMAVPAFAASVEEPYFPDYPLPDADYPYITIGYFGTEASTVRKSFVTSDKPLVANTSYDYNAGSNIMIQPGSYRWYYYDSNNQSWVLWLSRANQASGTSVVFSQPSDYLNSLYYINYSLKNSNGITLASPSPSLIEPPDLGQEVTGVLPTVLSWIQQTLNALFVEGGALQGLLLLVAVPVAITLLFLGARFIRSLIWGA